MAQPRTGSFHSAWARTGNRISGYPAQVHRQGSGTFLRAPLSSLLHVVMGQHSVVGAPKCNKDLCMITHFACIDKYCRPAVVNKQS